MVLKPQENPPPEKALPLRLQIGILPKMSLWLTSIKTAVMTIKLKWMSQGMLSPIPPSTWASLADRLTSANKPPN